MKQLFKLFMALHVGMYQMTAGKWGGKMRGFNVILLHTKGRKSGKSYTTPLGYFEHSDGYVIVASNAGMPTHPAWFFNLKSDPQVSVQIFEKVMQVKAEILSGAERTQAWQQVLATAPGYADYEKRTTREIPLILLHPVQ